MQSRRRGLTQSQLRLIELVARGLPNKEIATELGVSEQAVKERISALLLRLGVSNRAALAEVGLRAAIVGANVTSADWLPYLFLNAPIPMAFLRGPEHIFEAINEEGRRTIWRAELIGKPFRSALADGSSEVLRTLDDAYAEGRPRTLAAARVRWQHATTEADGERLVFFVVQPVLPADGEMGGVLLYALDTTSDAERARQALTS